MLYSFQRVCASLLLLGFMTLSTSLGHAETRSLAKGVSLGEYGTNWPRCVFIDSIESKISAAVTPNIGGRIVSYSYAGNNILFDGTAAGRKNMAGGYQCDIGPEGLDLPEHPTLWMGMNSWQFKPYTVKLISDSDDTLGLQVDKEITLEPDSGELGVTQWMKNTSSEDKSYCLWDRTLCKGGGFAFFKLNPKSFYPSGWAIHPDIHGSFHSEKGKVRSPYVKTMDGVVVVEARGEPTQIGADCNAGWIAYVHGDLLFVKYFPYFAKGDYSDDANTVELYVDNQVAELQVLSPEMKLKPQQNYSFPEKWTLIHLAKKVESFKDARKLADKIPASPFVKK